MIYLFDKHKKLKGTVRARHTIALLYERERNGIYSVSAEIPVSLTDKRTVYNYHKKVKGSDFLGHYDREGRFQLHKIAAVDIENTSIFIKGIHLFFDEAKAGAVIRESRFRGREIIDGARAAFDPIGWSVVDFDISDRKNYSFYNVSPLEARAILVETFGYEFDYWLDFDGKNLRNKQIAVKKKIGKETNKRYNYGHNVLSIKVEQDYSEIYTAVIGRGKGEDLDDSDGYGRRIEFTDVEWKKPSNPLDKVKGTRTLLDPTATQLFGYHDGDTVAPRTKVEIFSDIEDEAELLQASYEWLMDNNVPKAVFSLNVPDGDGLDLGDSVHVIYRDIDLIKSTRVTKVIDDLVSGNRSVEFGDTAYFETDRRISGLKADLKRVGGSASSRITRLKEEFDRRFDAEVQQWKDDFEQAVIDAEAAVEVMRAEMEEEFATVRTEMAERFEAEKDAAYEEAQRNYDAIADRITNVVDTTREEMNTAFEESVKESKEFASAEAEAKAQAVQSNLETFETKHSNLIADLNASVDSTFESINSEVLGLTTNLGALGESLRDVEGTLINTKTQLETQISDARTELEQSISNTRTELENKIVETENALNQVGEDLGDAKTDLQNQLDEARAELDGLEVGGRNLLEGSADINRSWETEGGSYNYLLRPRIQSIVPKVKVGDTLTISLDIDSEERTPIRIYDFNGNPSMTIGNHNFIVEKGKQRISFTTTLEESPLNGSIWIMDVYNNNNGVKFSISKIKIEKGTVATDWTPAPEDTDNKITNINQTITNIEGELSSKVEQTEVDALKGTVTAQGTLLTQTAEQVSSKAEKSVVDTLTGRVSNAESSVTQNANEIAKKLTKSVYDSDKQDTDAKITQWSNTASETAEGLTRVIGRVSETESGIETAQTRIEAEAGRIDGVLSRTSNVEGKVQDAELAIKANADGLALRATKTEVENAIDGIEVGGRNLLLDSDKYNSFMGSGSPTYEMLDEYKGKRNVLKVTNPGGYIIFNPAERYSMPYEVGQKYNVSFSAMYEGSDATNNPTIYMSGASGGYREFNNKMNNVSFTRINRTFTPSATSTNRIHMNFSGYEVVYIVMDFMIVRGSLPMDWSPAPEDIDASVSEVTDRVTVAEAELIVQAGEISQRATQSELDQVTGRVSTAETSIIQNAEEISRRLVKSDYDSDKEASDAEITKWSNLTTETAEGLAQTISRVESEEGKMTKAQADIIANAEEIATKVSNSEFNSLSGVVSDMSSEITQNANEIALKASQSSVNTLSGEVNSLESQLSIQADEIRGVVEDTSSLGAQVSDLRLTSDNFSVTIGEMEANLTEKINGVDTWHYNMLQGTRFDEPDKIKMWNGSIKTDEEVPYYEYNANPYQGWVEFTEEIQFEAGRQYTLSFDAQTLGVKKMDYTFIIASPDDGGANMQIHREDVQDSGTNNNIFLYSQYRRYWIKFTPDRNILGTIRIGANLVNNERGYRPFKLRLPYLTTTDNTRWLYHQLDSSQNVEEVTRRISKLEQTAESIDLMVAEISNTAVRQSEIYVGTSGIQIGSTYVGDTQLASILSVSPKSIDVITDNMNITGNVNVKGQIESIAMSAVRGDFAKLFANQVEANVIDVDHIKGRTAWFERLYTLSTNIEKLTSQFIFTNAIHAKSLDAIEANIGRVRTAFLEANVIKGSHISSNTIEVKHLTGYDAILNTLMARAVFSNEVKTLSIDAVEANIGSVRSQILTSNVIQSSHIAGGTALIDKIYSSNAMFERMMSKSGFVSSLSAITLDLHELTIWRPDGVAVIQNGMQRFGLPVTFVQQVDGGGAGEVLIHPNYWETNSRSSRTVGAIFTEHAGRWLNVGVGVGLRADAQHASTRMAVVIRPANTPSGVAWGTHIEEFTVYRGSTHYYNINVPLGRPTFGAASWTLEFYRIGDNNRNPVQLRRRRVWVSA